MSTDPRAFYKALDDLESLDLSFTLSEAGLEDDRVVLHVASNEVDRVVAYFEEHPFTLADGSIMSVEVLGGAGGWASDPVQGWLGEPESLTLEDLVGLEVREAAGRANAKGWLVRAHEPEAPLTADMRPNRLNLCYSPQGIVTDAHFG